MSTEVGLLQEVNAWVSLFMALACFLFVAAYAALARWWTSYEGRIMMGKAVALALLGAYTFYVGEINPDAYWARVVRAAVVVAIGVFMLFQTVVMARAQLRRRHREREHLS